jgi:hypothetical protein
MNKPVVPCRLALLPAAALLALLAACGGGGDSGSASAVSQETAKAMSANSTVVPDDTTDAAAAMLATTQAVVAGGTASQTFSCAGGGTAVFTASGGSLASLSNHVLDAGEVYSVTYTGCKVSSGAATLDGTATLTVVSATAGAVQVNTSTQGITVTLPNRVVTLNGSSTLTQTVVTNGATTTTTNHWTSPQIVVTSQRNARNSTFTLSAVDITRSVSVTNGSISGSSIEGTHTMTAALPNATWSITTATQGTVMFDANGMPTQGTWTVTLPNNRIGISIVTGTPTSTLSVTVDHGPDGTIDATYTFTWTQIAAEAG